VICVAKRVFDVLVSVCAILLLAPLLAAIAVAIKCESPGPILFKQVRVGLNGRPFTILKFRSMVQNATDLAPNVSVADDPRITVVGAFIRRWFLDELPQLINVLMGEMSVVGPRPETPEYVALYSPEERRVFAIRPGIVGPSTLAFVDEPQILARRDDPHEFYVTVLMHQRVQLDLEYLEHQSVAYDLQLLAKQLQRILWRD